VSPVSAGSTSRVIGCLKLQVSFRKRATNYRAALRRVACKAGARRLLSAGSTSRECVVMCRSVLQCVAVCCSVLQFVAVCCNILDCRYRVAKTDRIPQVAGHFSQKSH